MCTMHNMMYMYNILHTYLYEPLKFSNIPKRTNEVTTLNILNDGSISEYVTDEQDTELMYSFYNTDEFNVINNNAIQYFKNIERKMVKKLL